MVSDCGPGCKARKTTYCLEVERGREGVRLWTRMQTEQDNVQTEGGEGASWCEIVNPDAHGAEQLTLWRWRGARWCQIVDVDAAEVGQRTS